MGASSIGCTSQTVFQQRMDFLDHAPLEPRRTKRLRALAKLQLLVKTAWGLPWSEAAVRLANLCGRIRESCCAPSSGTSW